MKHAFRLFCLSLLVVCLWAARATAQTPTPTPTPDAFIAQITDTTFETGSTANSVLGDGGAYVGDVSGDGRFIVFESRNDINSIALGQTTRSPGNADGNREIFLYDVAQRRIFQITNTQSALVNMTGSATDLTNIAVEVSNNRPQISRDGRWIIFSSNAPTPGDFNGNTAANKAALQADGNQELFLYQVPAAGSADLTSGMEPGYFDLRGGAFTRLTDTPASILPRAGDALLGTIVADDNHSATINDNGTRIAFISNRNLTPATGPRNNAKANADGNPEVFVYNRVSAAANKTTQLTDTTGDFVFNDTPAISGDTDDTGAQAATSVIAFYSNANIPDTGQSAGNNADGNAEVYYATYNGLIETGFRQVTRTRRQTASQVLNALNFGRRVSRDGRRIAFESLANDPGADTTSNATASTVFVYNITGGTFVAVGPRSSDAEAQVNTSDRPRLPTFTSDGNQLVFTSTLNITPTGGRLDGGNTAGLNPDRISQVFVAPVPTTTGDVPVTRLTNILRTQVLGSNAAAGIQFVVGNTPERIAFSFPGVELGGGNSDLTAEVYYLVTPPAAGAVNRPVDTTALAYFTGASRRDVLTPTATPTPTPSPTPAATPLAGLAPGMVGIVSRAAATGVPLAPSAKMVGCMPASAGCDATSDTHRRPALPFELNGVSLAINGAAAGLYFVSPDEIRFLVPRGLAATTGTTSYPVTINVRGSAGVTVIRSLLRIVAVQPDIFSTTNGPGGRAVVTNVTNPLLATGTPEPFTVTTTYVNSSMTMVTEATKLRLILTGVNNAVASAFTVRLVKADGTATDITGTNVEALTPVPNMIGLFQLDFRLPASLAGAGDVSVIVIHSSGAQSRPADTAPRFTIN